MVDFLIIGPVNAVNYIEVFPLIREGRIRFGVEFSRCHIFFLYEGKEIDVSGVCYFTILDNNRKETWVCSEVYEEGKYRKFDNVDAINIDDCRMIPADYKGQMGVPLTFLRKWDPGEFEILDMMKDTRVMVDGEMKYVRILIRRK